MTLKPVDYQNTPIETFIRDQIGAAEQLWKNSSGTQKLLVLGKATIVLRFIGDSLKEVALPVLQHAIKTQENPQNQEKPQNSATIYLISSAEADFPAPPEDWPFPLDTPAAMLRTYWNTSAGLALSSDESRGIWHLHNMSSDTGLYWVNSAKELPYWEYGSALRHHINWISMTRGQTMMHAAVVSNGHGAALLAGPGGSGKSTMTAAAFSQGWQSTGDDFVLISDAQNPTSYSVFDVMKLTGMAETLFPDFTSTAINPKRLPSEKALVRLSSTCGKQFVEQLPITALFSIKLSGKDKTVIRPTSKFDLVKALVPSTTVILRTGMNELFGFGSELARGLPCYEFCVGLDPFEGLQVLDEFLESIA